MNNSLFKTNLFLKTTLVIFGIFFAACSEKRTQSKSEVSPSHSNVSSADDSNKKELMDAPDFTLNDRHGEPFTLSNHEGKVVVLNIWATWCPPCRKEIPDFIKIQKEMRDDSVLFVGVSEDKEGWDIVRPFVKENNINYPVVVDDGTVYRKYGPFKGIPTTFIINKEGKVEYASAGMLNDQILRPVLEKLVSH